VSPAGGNFEEPVTQATLSVVGAFHGLSRARSDARRYPAIDPLISWTKYLDEVGSFLSKKVPSWGKKVKTAHSFLHQGDEIGKRMEVVGEEGIALKDMVLFLKSELYEFAYLQQNAFDKEDSYCPLDRQLPLFELVCEIFDKDFLFDNHDEARAFFLSLQNEMKNMNFMSFQSQQYLQAFHRIQDKVQKAGEKKEQA
jgi:V/A-type H+-transporting ATPase subunit A